MNTDAERFRAGIKNALNECSIRHRQKLSLFSFLSVFICVCGYLFFAASFRFRPEPKAAEDDGAPQLAGTTQLEWGARPPRAQQVAPSRSALARESSAPFYVLRRARVRREGAPNSSWAAALQKPIALFRT
jgi:hypothetical protein